MLRTILDKLFKPKVTKVALRGDYRVYDMKTMRGWGNNAFWWPDNAIGKSACIFGPTPRLGDIVLYDHSAYLIITVDTPRDPGDQHFVGVHHWSNAGDLPPSRPTGTIMDDLV